MTALECHEDLNGVSYLPALKGGGALGTFCSEAIIPSMIKMLIQGDFFFFVAKNSGCSVFRDK